MHQPSHDKQAASEAEVVRRDDKGGKGKGSKGGGKKQRCKTTGCNEHQEKPYCNAHYRKWQADSNSDTRGVKRAAKADVKAAKVELKAEERKAEKLQVYKKVIKKAKAIGAAKERKRAASAIAEGDDEEEGFDWDRLNRSKGAPKSVKAARRNRSKASNANSLQELLMEDSDDSD